MKFKVASFLAIGFALVAVRGGAANQAQSAANLANAHISALVLIQRFAQALYHFGPSSIGGKCQIGDWVDKGDGTFTQSIQCSDGTKVVNTSYGGSPSDFDQSITYASGIHELLQARTVTKFNLAPGKVHFKHQFSTGDRVEYDQELQQEAALDDQGNVIPGLNFWYALISTGTVQLAGGQSLQFELRQTKSFDCFNFFNGTDLPDDICNEWFVFNADLGVKVPKPDRLKVTFSGGGSMELNIPVLDPGAGIPDFSQPATGKLIIAGLTLNVSLTTDTPDLPGWKFWTTSGPGFNGSFVLGDGFSGRGQAFRPGRGGPRASGGGRGQIVFAGRWNKSGIGSVILADGQTRPVGPTGGLLEFGNLRWSGLAAAYGPAPGL